jgi:hypothetical protein
MFKNSRFSTGFVIGFGAGFVSRDLMASSGSVFRPLVKGFLKTGVALAEKGRESLAHVLETVEDLLAEVRSESKPAPAEPPAASPAQPQVKIKVTQ